MRDEVALTVEMTDTRIYSTHAREQTVQNVTLREKATADNGGFTAKHNYQKKGVVCVTTASQPFQCSDVRRQFTTASQPFPCSDVRRQFTTASQPFPCSNVRRQFTPLVRSLSSNNASISRKHLFTPFHLVKPPINAMTSLITQRPPH
ncbi:hypothetical protein LSAT2_022607 [Lamellibrachia satsuma]|nr:hypothetical protein LSAT2_022607 [Lamellibrachia satsuma]